MSSQGYLAGISISELTRNSYRTTLNQRETVEDAEERSRLLKDCHTRCAERTLKALESNGGIFIKLGQHLVCYAASASRLTPADDAGCRAP